MISVLGWELGTAVQRLTADGYELLLEVVKSRKGLAGNEKRVVRQQALAELPNTLRLTYAVFQTQPQI